MSTSADQTSSAREQLLALASRGLASPWRHARGEFTAEARPASVLVLFGVLDGLPSTHEAQARAVSHDLDVLLLARATTLRNHAGQVAFPGGGADPGESAVEAALREATEETGLDASGVEVLGEFDPLPMPVSNHLVTPVLGWWRQPTPVRVVDVGESSHVFRAPVADLLDPAGRRTVVLHRSGRTYRGPGFLVEADGTEHLVWGFTAGVLDALFDQLGWTEEWDRGAELEL